MWKPTNQPQTPGRPAEPERPTPPTPSAPMMASSEPAAPPRPVTTTTADQATIGKSLVIKGEVTGSESLYIDGRVEGSINLSGNRVTVGRNGVVAANINAREIVVLGKVRGNLTASDRVDIRSDGSLTGDVIAARISIEDGAFFKGGIDIRKGGQPQQPKANGEEKTSKEAEPAAAGARA
ncbi:MAG TPA: polymer-forming cytoskeletal protein [Candidatus Acidoferrum sp.]|jgi:cytoskeletal protein CcmA (bactofilin family)|nr:polymer-forming cytoskeletal protein [Candidatus Acidoferrum sp.]